MKATTYKQLFQMYNLLDRIGSPCQSGQDIGHTWPWEALEAQSLLDYYSESNLYLCAVINIRKQIIC